MILFSNVQKKYGDHQVLHDINFHIKPGGFVCIIGKSGVGKSTIAHMMMGGELPSEGKIMVKGAVVPLLSADELQRFRQGIGVIFQDFKLLEEKTVFENIAFALQVTGEPEKNILKKVYDALETVGLMDHMNKFPTYLSGGERQRVAIARAIVHQPSLLIADEPTGNLDPENTAQIAQLLVKLNKEYGVTVVLTTHDPFLVKEVSPRILVLEEGVITKDLPPGTLFPSYG